MVSLMITIHKLTYVISFKSIVISNPSFVGIIKRVIYIRLRFIIFLLVQYSQIFAPTFFFCVFNISLEKPLISI